MVLGCYLKICTATATTKKESFIFSDFQAFAAFFCHWMITLALRSQNCIFYLFAFISNDSKKNDRKKALDDDDDYAWLLEYIQKS